MLFPHQPGLITTALQAAQMLVDIATEEANKTSEDRDEKESERLQEAYGKGVSGRRIATGAAEAVKELENEQKSRIIRIVRDSIDGALLNLATFYRDVMMAQCDDSESIINTDMGEQIEKSAANSLPNSTINKINAIMASRENLARNAAPLVTCEALMCKLSKP